MDWAEGDLVWFDPGVGHPIPGEIQEVHRAAQVIVVQAMIKGKVSRRSTHLECACEMLSFKSASNMEAKSINVVVLLWFLYYLFLLHLSLSLSY